MKTAGIILLTLSIVVLFTCVIFWTYFYVSFNMNCLQYLKRSADANTIELAQQNLQTAISYLEKNNLTNGVVSIFLRQPENDIGFWYSNMKASMDELSKVNEKTSQLEKTNILMKLRETLTDISGQNGTVITCPDGISIHPYNKLYFSIILVFSIVGVLGIISICKDDFDY